MYKERTDVPYKVTPRKLYPGANLAADHNPWYYEIQ